MSSVFAATSAGGASEVDVQPETGTLDNVDPSPWYAIASILPELANNVIPNPTCIVAPVWIPA